MVSSSISVGEAGESRTLYGVGASLGIAVGRILVLKRKTHKAARHHISAKQVEAETVRFFEAAARAEEELLTLRNRFQEDLADALSIIDSHLLMVRDKMILDRSVEIIREKEVNAEWALAQALVRIEAKFAKIADPYIKARFNDIKYVADRIFGLLGGRESDSWEGLNQTIIPVAHDFSPEDVIRMHAKNVRGFVTEKGGMTSHTAIVARSLGMVSVTGLKDVTMICSTNDAVILDGFNGRVVLHPSFEQEKQYYTYQQRYLDVLRELSTTVNLPSVTEDGYQVSLAGNIEMLDELGLVTDYGADGIGLFRSEFDFFQKDMLPDEEVMFATYREMLSNLSPKPVTIRVLDTGGDKFVNRLHFSGGHYRQERNPALGLRSIRYLLRHPELLSTQLRAMLRASRYGKLRILLPMISSVDELRKVKVILEEVRVQLESEGVEYNSGVELGIMVEVPSAVIMADVLAREVDFFSIGTNDLIQYSLAIDRNNEFVAHMYDPLQPAVLRMIHQTVEAARLENKEVICCGETAGDLAVAPLLLGLGVRGLSMRPAAIPFVKQMIRSSTMARLTELGEQALRCSAADEVREVLQDYLPKHYPELFGDL
ncbi:MAG: phosphoenolpyruvate--protein phosphotransferase [Desulfobulbaceae bacterium]|nr:phosphoenolpyruvate--protein phosphotransferase [Desulfobulbaceae bacterium]